jgi:hypothetical protein
MQEDASVHWFITGFLCILEREGEIKGYRAW